MSEERCESKFEICLRDISKDDAWMLTYIVVHMLKDQTCIRDIYQMLTSDNTTNNLEVADHAIDYILLDSLSYGGEHASRILRHQDVKTESELLKFVYTDWFEPGYAVYRLGPSALADIAAYMNIRNIIPNDSDMSDVISHFMTGAKAAKTLRLANAKYKNYMDAHAQK